MGNDINKQEKRRLSDHLLLYAALFIYSLTLNFGKLASGHPMFSFKFLFFYGIEILFMLIYSFLWQIVLKRFPLTVAYANKPLATILGLLWGVLIFHETVSWRMLLGTIIILFGIWIVVTDHGL